MSKLITILFLVSLIVACQRQKDVISFESLLDEMIDREQLAKFPMPDYRLKQQSSYNRKSISPSDTEGWFANSDGKDFIRIDTINGRPEWVLMEHKKPGVMGRIWMPDKRISPHAVGKKQKNTQNPGTLRVYLDDNPNPILEGHPNDLFNGTTLFDYPFGHKSLSSCVSFLPILWAKNCKITLDAKPFYYIFTYREYKEGTPMKSFTKTDLTNAAHKLKRVGNILVNPQNSKDNISSLKKTLEPQNEVSLDLPEGESSIRMISLKLGNYENPQVTRSLILKIEFDDQETVWCPVGDFFGTGVGLHPFKGWNRTVTADGTLTCRWVMPYKKTAKITLLNLSNLSIDLQMNVSVGSWEWDERSMYFHGNWKFESDINTNPHSDWNYITLNGRGVYVGDALTVWNPIEAWWGEGDAKIWIDNEQFPSIFGTGTEDYYAYSWGGKNRAFYEHPFHAQVRVDKYDKNYSEDVPYEWITKGYSTETRTRSIDCMPFSESLKVDMEVWHARYKKEPKMDYSVATYWYGFPETKTNIKPMPKEATKLVREIQENVE